MQSSDLIVKQYWLSIRNLNLLANATFRHLVICTQVKGYFSTICLNALSHDIRHTPTECHRDFIFKLLKMEDEINNLNMTFCRNYICS